MNEILSPSDARFIGNPIDFVVFDGYTKAKDDKGDAIGVVLLEVKKGKGKLSWEETLIKKAVEEGRVSWGVVVAAIVNVFGSSQYMSILIVAIATVIALFEIWWLNFWYFPSE